jgi:hypothetical protein
MPVKSLVKLVAGLTMTMIILSAMPAHATTAADVKLPPDRIQLALACIGIIDVSITYTDDGTPMGYDREEMADVGGLWAQWVAQMTGLPINDIYEHDDVYGYADDFQSNRENAAEQLRFCMTELPD